ncbi:MAG: sigma-54 dependent transcriptional regulator [Candidatus Hydrogenedentota bacterium]
MSTILAIDDEESVRQSYRVILEHQYDLALAANGDEGLAFLDTHQVDLILLDLTMPGLSGEEVLDRLRERGNSTPVIVVTASNSITSAVEAMKRGATDYIQKPFDVHDLQANIERAIEESRDKRELESLREAESINFKSIIGNSTALNEALNNARQAMKVDSAVLITGESGTGKDLLARSIHNGGARSKHAFVPLSCCAIPAQLVESELFGYEKGAFTGADKSRVGKMKVADGGTLFLDEIGEMPVEAQVKLLRVLQDNRFYPVGSTKEIKVDIRIVCATNRDLPQAIKEGVFREDLYYRVNVLNIEMPPLRKRREDIPLLIEHFIAKHCPRVNARTQIVSPKAMNLMSTFDWPGNIRELENSIERLLVYHGQEHTIDEEHVRSLFPNASATPANAAPATGHLSDYEGLPLEDATRQIEAHLISRALEQSNYVQSRAAEVLGTTRRILKYKIDQLGIDADKAS